MFGAGDLMAHHMLCILALLGVVHPNHALTASFCKENNTTMRLRDVYHLEPNDDLMATLCNEFKDDYKHKTSVMIENIVCEEKRNEDAYASGHFRFYDPIPLWRGAFLLDVTKEGKLIAMVKGSEENHNVASYIDSAVKHDFDGGNCAMKYDFTVIDEPCEAVLTIKWWNDVTPVIPMKSFQAKDEQQAELFQQKKSKLTMKRSADVEATDMKPTCWSAAPPQEHKKDRTRRRRLLRDLGAHLQMTLVHGTCIEDVMKVSFIHVVDRLARFVQGSSEELTSIIDDVRSLVEEHVGADPWETKLELSRRENINSWVVDLISKVSDRLDIKTEDEADKKLNDSVESPMRMKVGNLVFPTYGALFFIANEPGIKKEFNFLVLANDAMKSLLKVCSFCFPCNLNGFS